MKNSESMKKAFVLTMIGPDRPGIVKQLSSILSAHNANWLESKMANLAGEFAGILHASVDTANYQNLLRSLDQLQTEDLQIIVRQSGETGASKIAYHLAELEVVGTDREGIVRDITEALGKFSINVEELATEFTEAAMSAAPLFKATARLSIPAQTNLDQVQTEIEKIAHDLMSEFRLDN